MEMEYKITASTVKAAFTAIITESITTAEKIKMLTDLANELQKNSQNSEELWSAVGLYERALEMFDGEYPLLKARIQVGLANTLQAIPDESAELLLQAKAAYLEALPILQELGFSLEIAEVQMNLGIVLQALFPWNLAKITDSIQAYQQALRVFTPKEYPQEYAILYNNIAIAYLSMPGDTEQRSLCEKLAMQTFEEVLKQINVIDYPQEYALLQNNLGNALQKLESNNTIENNLRAIAAYDEALTVRNSQDTPLDYANTIANKANALINLPDDPEKPELGNYQNRLKAISYYQEAIEIFTRYHHIEQAKILSQILQEERNREQGRGNRDVG
jgi:tetratricopeptide (TPR) repeat protein